MILLYAFPRTGCTMLSIILMNHPDVFVTSELYQGTKRLPHTDSRFSWENNVKAMNFKFGLDLREDASLEQVDSILKQHGKLLIYRAWVPGYVENLNEIDAFVHPEKRVILLRNFFHSVLSAYDSRGIGMRARLEAFGKKLQIRLLRIQIPKDELFRWFKMYRLYIEHVLSIEDRSKLNIHYEDLLRDPICEVGRIFDYLDLDKSCLNDCLKLGSGAGRTSKILSGDSRARRTLSVMPGRKYPKWRIEESSYQEVLEYLKQYSFLKYLGLD